MNSRLNWSCYRKGASGGYIFLRLEWLLIYYGSFVFKAWTWTYSETFPLKFLTVQRYNRNVQAVHAERSEMFSNSRSRYARVQRFNFKENLDKLALNYHSFIKFICPRRHRIYARIQKRVPSNIYWEGLTCRINWWETRLGNSVKAFHNS